MCVGTIAPETDVDFNTLAWSDTTVSGTEQFVESDENGWVAYTGSSVPEVTACFGACSVTAADTRSAVRAEQSNDAYTVRVQGDSLVKLTIDNIVGDIEVGSCDAAYPHIPRASIWGRVGDMRISTTIGSMTIPNCGGFNDVRRIYVDGIWSDVASIGDGSITTQSGDSYDYIHADVSLWSQNHRSTEVPTPVVFEGGLFEIVENVLGEWTLKNTSTHQVTFDTSQQRWIEAISPDGVYVVNSTSYVAYENYWIKQSEASGIDFIECSVPGYDACRLFNNKFMVPDSQGTDAYSTKSVNSQSYLFGELYGTRDEVRAFYETTTDCHEPLPYNDMQSWKQVEEGTQVSINGQNYTLDYATLRVADNKIYPLHTFDVFLFNGRVSQRGLFGGSRRCIQKSVSEWSWY